MPERRFPTETWTEDDWFQSLNRDQRYLFWYLWANQHCKQSGLYYLPLPTLAWETKFLEMELPDLLKSLFPKVVWYPDRNLIWVKNFIKRNANSPTFLKAAADCLKAIKEKEVIKELLEYNYHTYTISIPYEDSVGMIPIPTDYHSTPITITNTIKEGGLIKQVWAGLNKRRDYESPGRGKEGQAMKWMLEQGYTPDQILATYDTMKRDKFWADKHLDMQSVKKQIGEAVKGKHKKGGDAPSRYKPVN